MLPQARKYIAESMGVKYAEGVILNLEEMWHESTPRVPMVCFLSMGSDPTNSIDMLARKHDLSKRRFKIVYLHVCVSLCSFWFGINGARPGGSCKTTDTAMPLTGMLYIPSVKLLSLHTALYREAGLCCKTLTWV